MVAMVRDKFWRCPKCGKMLPKGGKVRANPVGGRCCNWECNGHDEAGFLPLGACPLNTEMLELLQAYDHRLEIHTHDIAKRPRPCWGAWDVLSHVDGGERLSSICCPSAPGVPGAALSRELPSELPYRPALGRTPVTGTVLPITKENVDLAGHCVGHEGPGCRQKAAAPGDGPFCLRVSPCTGNRLLGGAEYVPSVHVPYGIPGIPARRF